MAQINVGNAISDALTRTGAVLFRPFRARKWAWIAVCATLTLAGQGGMNFNFGNPFSSSGGGGGAPFPSAADSKAFLLAHLAVIVTVTVLVMVLICTLYLVTRWINSRAQFMLMDNVVRNDDRVKESWRENRTLGNSLFKFRILYDLVMFNVFLVIVGITAAIAWADIWGWLVTGNYRFGGASVGGLVFLIVSMLVYLVLAMLVSGVVFDLGVPVMYVRGMMAWPAVKVAWTELFLLHKGACILFMLFMFVVRLAQGMWMGLSTIVLMIVTCCTIMILMMVPIMGMYPFALLSLPTLVYERAYKLYFVSQFGEAYRVNWQTSPVGAFPVVLNDPAAVEGPWVPPEPPLR